MSLTDSAPLPSASSTASKANAVFPAAQRRLSELLAGETARVADLVAPEDQAARLKSLGICVGREIQLVQSGDPLIVRVYSTRVGISSRLAADVLVSAL